MRRNLSYWLLALALLFGQQAAQLHALSHVDGTAPAGHPAEHCLAFHAVDSVLPGSVPVADPFRAHPTPPAHVATPIARLPSLCYEPRGPPQSS